MLLRDDLLSNFEYWIAYTSRIVEKAANEILAEHGLTYRQVKLLACLIVRGPLAQTELADRIQVEPSTIVRLVDRMERDGWVKRQSDPADKRKNIVTLTQSVDELGDTIMQCANQMHEEAFCGIEKERIKITIQTLSDICSNLSSDTYPAMPDSVTNHKADS